MVFEACGPRVEGAEFRIDREVPVRFNEMGIAALHPSYEADSCVRGGSPVMGIAALHPSYMVIADLSGNI